MPEATAAVEAAIRGVLATIDLPRFDLAQRRMPPAAVDALTKHLLASDWSLMWADAHITDVLDDAPEYWGEGTEADITAILTALQNALAAIGHPFTMNTENDRMLAKAHMKGEAVHPSRCCVFEPPHDHW